MITRLDLPRTTVNRLLADAQRSPGVEVCGFVVRDGGEVAVLPVRNLADDPAHRFDMDPAGMVDAFRRVREDGVDIVAIYHSHPDTAAVPSALDRELAYYPDLAYLIVSLGTRGVLELRGFRVAGGDATELDLVVT